MAAVPPSTFTRTTVRDPEINTALQDLQNKLSQVQERLSTQTISPQSIVIQVGTVLKIGPQGQILSVTQP
jgi:hypothetical protein